MTSRNSCFGGNLTWEGIMYAPDHNECVNGELVLCSKTCCLVCMCSKYGNG